MRGRVDATQREIVDALEALGATVVDLSQVGSGTPDLLIGCQGRAWLAECKTAKGKLRDTQIEFAAAWRGPAIAVLRSADQAVGWLTTELRRAR